MKRYLNRFVLAAVLAAIACGGGDDSTGPEGSSGSMSATVDGVAFSASMAVMGTRSGTTLVIGGVDDDQRQIQFALTNVPGAGTYQLGTAGGGNTATYSEGTKAWVSSLVGGTGSVTISSLDADGARGTFSFTAQPGTTTGAAGTKNVAEGSFDVEF